MKPKIMVVCGFGLGTSLILKMALDEMLQSEGITATTFCSDEATAKAQEFDIVFTSAQFEGLFKDSGRPVVVIKNFLSKDEIKEKGLALIYQLLD